MRRTACLLAVGAALLPANADESDERPNAPGGREVIERSVAFHDPDERWSTWKATVELAFEDPEGKISTTRVRFDNALGFYEWSHDVEGATIVTGVDGDRCFACAEDGTELDTEFLEKNKITCANTKKMRNYHGYLYGLPMKVLDPGTQCEDEVKRLELNGQSYLVVRVPYEQDVWDFFIHPETYALAAYRFYKDEAAELGEIIHLEALETIQGIRLPKRRAWYNTHDGKYLGTDIVASGTGFESGAGTCPSTHR